MTDADLLRDNLDRLHAAGIAKKLKCITPTGYFSLWGRSEPDDIAITYAIGAMVQAMHNAEQLDAYPFTLDPGDSVLAACIDIAESFGLIPPKEPA